MPEQDQDQPGAGAPSVPESQSHPENRWLRERMEKLEARMRRHFKDDDEEDEKPPQPAPVRIGADGRPFTVGDVVATESGQTFRVVGMIGPLHGVSVVTKASQVCRVSDNDDVDKARAEALAGATLEAPAARAADDSDTVIWGN